MKPGLATGLLLVLAGFSGSAAPAATAHAWTRTGLGVVTQPAPSAGRFVFYAQHGGSLAVVALDASDGATAWTAPASPSDVTAGQPVELAVRAGTVFYLEGVASQPAALGMARVVARSVASGAVLWRSAAGRFATVPEICPDQSNAVCVNGAISANGWGEFRFSASSGRVVGLAKMGTASSPGRELGPDLFDPGSRSPEKLLAVRGGRVAWQRPLATIFTLPHASSDGGWNFDRFAKLGLFVGSVSTRPEISGGRYRVNLGRSMTVGIALGSGRVKWRTKGDYSCGQPLPCAGRTAVGYTSPATGSPASVGVRLLETGTATGSIGGGKPKISSNAAVTVQGFDPATGRTTWSFAAGRDLFLIAGLGSQPLAGPASVVIERGSGRIALDLRSGKAHAEPSSARAWCQRFILYRLAHTAYYRGGGGRYVGQDALYPCTAAGRRVGLPGKIPSLVGLVGATTGGMTAWTDSAAVHAVPGRG